MKKFGLFMLAAVAGSALTLGTFFYFGYGDSRTVKIEHITGSPVMGAAYTLNPEGELIPLDFTQVAGQVMPAVVHIRSTQVFNVQRQQRQQMPDPFRDFFEDDFFRHFFGPHFRGDSPRPQQPGPQTRVGSGSGVIISSDGYIVTNYHVIRNSDDIEVTLDDNRVFKAKVIGTDPSTDLALLQVRGDDLPSIPFADSDKVKVGEWVLAVGNPFNLNSTVTAGIISAKGRHINILQDQSAIESFLQTDAAINPGNSGGALVNMQGALVGINTAIASPTGSYAGYGFAVPSNIVSKVVSDLIEYGMVQRGYLGLMIRSVDGNLAREKGLQVNRGVYVDSVSVNSAAGDAGVIVGDVIVEINGNEVNTTSKLLEIVGRQHPGDRVNLKVNREGREMNFTVTLRNIEGKEKKFERSTQEILDRLGIELEAIDRPTSRRLQVDSGLRITRIYPGILQRATEIREGFIITRVDGRSMKSVDEFVKYLENKTGGVMLEGVYEDLPGTYYYAFGL